MSRGKVAPTLRLFVDGSDDHPRWQIKTQAARELRALLATDRAARGLARAYARTGFPGGAEAMGRAWGRLFKALRPARSQSKKGARK